MLLEHSRTLRVIAPALVTDVIDMPYSPALLLDGRFDVSLTDDPEFHDVCEWGFHSYFDDMWDVRPGATSRGFDDFILVERRYTVAYVMGEVLANMRGTNDAGSSLVRCVGVSLGWLSALALVQCSEALEGLAVLLLCVQCEQAKLVQVQMPAA